MARIASTVLVVALLAATAAAFAITQGLKAQPSPIRGTKVDDVFSPVCGCDTETASISFRLREGDRLDVAIVDGAGDVVRTIERGRDYDAGPVRIEWDGRDDRGRLLPEAEYRPRVRLRDEHKTITLPNPIRIDVVPPRIERVVPSRLAFSPDGDRRADRVTFRYRLSEPGKGMLLVDGRRRVLTLYPRTADKLDWFGKVSGRVLRPGVYTMRLAAVDPAGNVGAQSRPFAVALRYVTLGRERITVAAGARFALRVSSDARVVSWRLGRRSGVARPGTLRLRAPLQKGQFTLTVSANGHVSRAAVFVREPAR